MLNTGSAMRSESKKLMPTSSAPTSSTHMSRDNLNNYVTHHIDIPQNNLHIGGQNLNPLISDVRPEHKQESIPAMIPQQNPTHINNETIMIEVKDGKFLFSNNDRIFLGGFTGEELVKYIVCNSTPSFMPNINSSHSKEIIEKYICRTEPDQGTNNAKYHIINHLDSPFTGHVEMLVRLYRQIDEFEQNKLASELSSLPKHDADNAKKTFYSFILVLLRHILKIISILSDIIKTNKDQSLNNKLLKYSVSIMHKISTVTKNQIGEKLNMIDTLLAEREKIQNIQQILSNKIEDLEETINEQDIKINALYRNTHMTGGNQSDVNSEIFESSTRSDGSIASSSSNINNVTDVITESTTLSDILNNRHKLKYSDTSTFNSDNIIRDSLRHKKHHNTKDSEYSYLVSNDVSHTNKIIDI